MNVKQWALFFIVTLSVNYVSATFLPVRGSSYRRRGNYNQCNKYLRGFLSSKMDSFRDSFVSKYGRQCSLGQRELEDYKLRNVRAKGLGNFRFGDSCDYYVDDDGQAFIRFALSFEEIVASFVLFIPEAAGGIFAQFSAAIFGIIGSWFNKILQIAFPPFLCDIGLRGDYENGFSLSDFQIGKPRGNIGFLGGLSGYEDSLSSFSSLLFAPLEFCINLFLTSKFQPFMKQIVGSWDVDEDMFSRFGLGGRSGGRLGGGGSKYGSDSEEEESVEGGISGRSGYGGKTGGYRSGEEQEDGGSGNRRTSGRSRYGGKTGGYRSGGYRSGEEQEDGGSGKGRTSGRSRYGGKTGGYRSGGYRSGGYRSGGYRSGGYGSSEEQGDGDSGIRGGSGYSGEGDVDGGYGGDGYYSKGSKSYSYRYGYGDSYGDDDDDEDDE